jgi:UDPglucose 6-dehydrogenase
MRDAPSLDIIPVLQAAGAKVQAYDPAGMHEAKPLLPDVDWKDNAYDAATGADVLVIITEWNEFRALRLDRLAEIMKQRIIVDLRNVYNPADTAKAGFAYSSIGRPAVLPI